MNGSLAGWHSHAQLSGEADDDKWDRPDAPWSQNGVSAGWIARNKKDIAEPGMEPNTHAFANDNVDVMNWDKSKEPFIDNGSKAGWFAKSNKDIAEPGMEPNTHMFANDQVDVMNWDKSKEPFVPNGSQAGWLARSRKDISDKQVDEEVHGFASADTNVLPTAWRRSDEAPKTGYIPSPAEKESLAQGQYSSDDISFAGFDPAGPPEKVHFLEPGYHKHIADTNFPNTRTTFYSQQN